MRIRVLSDLHEEFASRLGGSLHFEPLDVDVTVLAGDIHNGVGAVELALRPCFANTTVLLVPGNHEYYGSVMPTVLQQMRSAIAQAQKRGQSNVHLLDNQSLQLGDTVFFGSTLWTDFALYGDPAQAMVTAQPRMVDYRLIQRAPHSLLTPGDTLQLHQTARRYLGEQLKTSDSRLTRVVITHHAPHERSIHSRFVNNSINPAFVSNLDELLGRSALWIHGHTHNGFDYTVNTTRIVANPAGYRSINNCAVNDLSRSWVFENPDFNPNKIITLP
jgi:Icc-related predicted phosphoesterase